jgi:ribosomal protein L24
MSEDFSKGKRGAVVKSDPNKQRITIRLDANVIEHFKRKVHEAGGGNLTTRSRSISRRMTGNWKRRSASPP